MHDRRRSPSEAALSDADMLWEGTAPAKKFREPGNIKIMVAGGTAGRFSALVPGWPFPNAPTRLVFRRLPP